MSDPVESAQAAGLRYVSDTMPGIRRKKAGKGFSYIAQDATTIRDEKELARIRSLAIPPAYTDVWICPSSNGHIQATGRDARRRKQYRYHAKILHNGTKEASKATLNPEEAAVVRLLRHVSGP